MLNDSDTIFSTGVFLKPLHVTINGKEQWRWVAVAFEDDSFLDEKYINPYIYSNYKDGLLEKNEDD